MPRRRVWEGQPPVDVPFTVNRDSWQTEGLIAWWPTLGAASTGRLVDLIYGNNGTPTNVTLAPSADVGKAAEFSGSSVITFTDVPALYDQSYVTIAGWMRIDAWSGNGAILQRRTSGAGGWTFELNNSVGSIQWFCYVGGAFRLMSTTGWPTSTWTHFACLYNGTSLVVYRNGFQIGITNFSGTLGTGTFTFQSGRNVGNNTFITGGLADLAIWNRALSAAEVFQLYAPQTRWQRYKPLRPHGFPSPDILPHVYPGYGEVVASATVISGGTGMLPGTGTASPVSGLVAPGNSLFTGAGVVTELPNLRIQGDVQAQGTGTLVDIPSILAQGTAHLEGTGVITDEASERLNSIATLLGAGTVSPSSSLKLTGSIALLGTAEAFESLGLLLDASAILVAEGILLDESTLILNVGVSVEGVGDAEYIPVLIVRASGIFQSDGQMPVVPGMALRAVTILVSEGLLRAMFEVPIVISHYGSVEISDRLVWFLVITDK